MIEEQILLLESKPPFYNPIEIVLFPKRKGLIKKVCIGHPREATKKDYKKAKDRVFAQLIKLGFSKPFFIPLKDSRDLGEDEDYVIGWQYGISNCPFQFNPLTNLEVRNYGDPDNTLISFDPIILPGKFREVLSSSIILAYQIRDKVNFKIPEMAVYIDLPRELDPGKLKDFPGVRKTIEDALVERRGEITQFNARKIKMVACGGYLCHL